jgi:hypothetical protein
MIHPETMFLLTPIEIKTKKQGFAKVRGDEKRRVNPVE